MSSFNIDPRGVLVDALKQKPDEFSLSNLILPNKNSLRAVYEIEAIKADMMEFAKNPEIGINMLGAPPKRPNTENMTEDEAATAEYEFEEMNEMYEQQKLALTMHVPYPDMIMINNYLKKFKDTLAATPAIKGKRFYAFTKNVEEHEGSFLDAFKRGG